MNRIAKISSVLSIFLILGLLGCKKVPQDIKETFMEKLITENQWRTTKLTIAGTEKVGELEGYIFIFKKDKTVDAVKNGTVVSTGTWQASEVNRTIESAFPVTTTPLEWYNGVWLITDTGLTPAYVISTRSENTETYILRLDAI